MLVKLGDDGKLNIPSTVENAGVTYTVTAIGEEAFYSGTQEYNESIKEVTFPDTLKKIGYGAFWLYPKLENIVLPDGIEEIGDWAFREIPEIKTIHLPKNLKTLGKLAFYQCTGLTSIEIPSGITEINLQTFSGCTNLTEVKLPDGLTTISREAFKNCQALKDINLPEGLESIGDGVFWSCSSLETIDLPESLRTIDMWGFRYCTSLTDITLNKNLETLEQCVFQGCTALTEITLPASLTNFYPNAFAETNCTVKTSNIGHYAALTKKIADEAKIEQDKANAGQTYNNTYKNLEPKLLDADGNEINAEVFVDGAYSYIVLDEHSVQLIGCTGNVPTGKLTLPSTATATNNKTYTVTSIGSNAFAKCEGITGLTLPENLERIESRAFDRCSNLATVDEFPASLTFIGNDAFYDCCLTTLSFPADSKLQTIDTSAFMWCEELTSVTLPEGLKTVGERAFESCSKLKSISFPASLQSLGSEVFYNCHALTEVTFAADCKLEEIPGNAFFSCALQTLELPANIKTIGGSAFLGCDRLQSVGLPDGLETIGVTAFYNNKALTGNLVIPASVSKIEASAFGQCTNEGLSIRIQGKNLLNNIANNAFDDVPLLTCDDPDIYTYLNSMKSKDSGPTEVQQPVTTYTVSVQSGDGGTASASSTSAAEGTEITLTATPDSGYHFKEWQVVSGSVTITNNQFTMPAGNVTVKAVFEKDSTGSSRPSGGGGSKRPGSSRPATPTTPTTPSQTQVQLDTQTVTMCRGAAYQFLVKHHNDVANMTVSSANPTIATVALADARDPRGAKYEVTATGIGSTQILVTYNGQTVTMTVNVQAPKGSMTLDTVQYTMAPGNQYTIGAFIRDENGNPLSAEQVRELVANGRLNVRDSRTGSIVTLTQQSNGHFCVTGKNEGTAYIIYEIGGTHASVRVDVKNGVKQGGNAVRNTSYFTE